MTVFDTAWSVLKNAPVPDFAQPKWTPDGAPYLQPNANNASHRSPSQNQNSEGLVEEARAKGRGTGATALPYNKRNFRPAYGTVERTERPDNTQAEDSFDTNRINTGTSVYNPAPTWQKPAVPKPNMPQQGNTNISPSSLDQYLPHEYKNNEGQENATAPQYY